MAAEVRADAGRSGAGAGGLRARLTVGPSLQAGLAHQSGDAPAADLVPATTQLGGDSQGPVGRRSLSETQAEDSRLMLGSTIP